jgi:hypothetical protein
LEKKIVLCKKGDEITGLDGIPDPDPAIFVIDLQDANKKLIFLTQFFC